MLNKIKNLIKLDKNFVRSGAIVFIGSMIVNVLNYIFHLVMGRSLGPASYGIAVTLISLLALFSVPISTVNTAVVKFTSEVSAKNQLGNITYLFKKLSLVFIIAGLIFIFVIMLCANSLGQFLNIDPLYIKIISVFVVFALFCALTRGILQGLKKFEIYSINLIVEVVAKIVFFLIFFYLGQKILGVTLALIFSAIIAFLTSLPYIKNILKLDSQPVSLKHLFKYSSYTFWVFVFITIITYIDIILVKHYFSPEVAGLYGALATAGKIIFFIANPIILVMFPMVSDAYEQNRKHFGLLAQTLLTVIGLSLAVLAIYYFFPQFVIKILYGQQFLSISVYLFRFGLAMLLFSLASLFTYYFLSIKKMSFLFFIITTAILELILIYLFHGSIGQIINDLIYSYSFLLVSLSVMYIIGKKNTIINLIKKTA